MRRGPHRSRAPVWRALVPMSSAATGSLQPTTEMTLGGAHRFDGTVQTYGAIGASGPMHRARAARDRASVGPGGGRSGRAVGLRLGSGRRSLASTPMTGLVSPVDVAPATDAIPRLLSIHAHPDDEASKGSATIARYVHEGAEAVLVTCTGGEEGEVLNPAMDRPDVHADLAAVRRDELARSAAVIGYRQVVLLGHRDSGMPDTPANARPDAFANVDLDVAVAQLAQILRRARPHVVLTYGDEQTRYPHPDHLRVHDISLPAIDLAADPHARQDLGEPWQVQKVYYSEWSRTRIVALHEAYLALGRESPYDERWFTQDPAVDAVTTRVDTTGFGAVRREALLAHATQVDPSSPFWFGLSVAEAEQAYPWEDYVLARSTVPTEFPEDDLLAGVVVDARSL